MDSPSSSPLRIAVLECDTPMKGVDAKYHGYLGVFTVLLHAAASQIGIPAQALDISGYDVVTKMEYPDLSSVDAVLLTGSKHDAFAEDEWTCKLVEFTKSVLTQRRVKLIGVCYGHQIIGRALGVKVGRDPNAQWEVSVCNVDLTAEGKALFQKDTLKIHQMHKDIVFDWPAGVTKLGTSPVCEVQGFYMPDRFITIQGHPEFNEEIMTELVETRYEQGIFGKEMHDDAKRRWSDKHDGVAVGVAFLKFLLEGR